MWSVLIHDRLCIHFFWCCRLKNDCVCHWVFVINNYNRQTAPRLEILKIGWGLVIITSVHNLMWKKVAFSWMKLLTAPPISRVSQPSIIIAHFHTDYEGLELKPHSLFMIIIQNKKRFFYSQPISMTCMDKIMTKNNS